MDSDRDDEVRGFAGVELDARPLVTIRSDRLRLGEPGAQEMTDRELLAAVLEIRGMPPQRVETLLAHAEALFGQEEVL